LRGEIIANTRALVKKQRTWFRTQLPTHRLVQAAELREVDALFPVSEIPG
jgi:tRNA dimethylallyltransferase